MGQGDSALIQNDVFEPTTSSDDNSIIQLSINDVVYAVGKDIPLDTSLNVFIRDYANLKGTKAMCQEGGCGACIISAKIMGEVKAVNSCLVPVILCNGWKVTTIEGIGGRNSGYHTFQTSMAEMNGSQCGYCSPAWVMNMYSLKQEKKMTMKEIENSFAGNICRCTGYRPILDVFKSFASDAPPAMKQKIIDIEEMYNVKPCKNCPNKTCIGTCKDMEIIYKFSVPRSFKLVFKNNAVLHEVLEIHEIFTILENKQSHQTYIISGGNTAHGVYRLGKVDAYINVNNVIELQRIVKEEDNLTLGANLTLTKIKQCFEKYMHDKGFNYLKVMVAHIDLVATIPIRNIGTLAGNLMIKWQHNEFPSDMFLMLEAAGAEIHLLESPSNKSIMTLMDFLRYDMQNKLVYSIVLPAIHDNNHFQTYKIMPRSQNAHAIVNAGFLFNLSDTGDILSKPNIIFGGINPTFLHASETENFLNGKNIFENAVLKKAFAILNSELHTDYVLPDYKPEFRKLLAVSLLYKFILSINPDKVSAKLKSGATLLKRELSSGKQNYETIPSLWPVNQPKPKVEGLYQTAGEAEYVGDIVMKGKQLYCALTIADNIGKIVKIDYEDVLKIEGVVAFYSAKDIPGKNAFISASNKFVFNSYDEIMFAEHEITYSGQIYGLVVAETQKLAEYAASKVKIVYPKGPSRKPMITVHDVLASGDQKRILKQANIPASKTPGTDIYGSVKGSYESGSQYHFTMEPQTCVCIPVEDGMDVFSATQYMDLTQTSIASFLNIPINSINLRVRRLGGGFGAKLTRATMTACACALACHKLNRPVRLVMSIEDMMRSVGKRFNSYMEYDVSFNKLGKIQKMNTVYYGNSGYTFNDGDANVVFSHFYSCYDYSTWKLLGYSVQTDVPSNTWCRAPCSTEALATIENIMERISRITNQDPVDVRLINMNDTDKEVLKIMIDEIKKTSDYEIRLNEVKKFNEENRWKKRGISLVPMKYPLDLAGQYHSLVSIYARDGTVSIAHGGIEMGQGINTKVAQMAAYTLGISIDMISIKPSNVLTSPNSFLTGGSICTDTCGYATVMACKELLQRLEPIRKKLGDPTWKQLTLAAQESNVDLCASFMFTTDQEIKSYSIYGTTVAEVEIDVLTGQHLVRRVDILEDTGMSINPDIDIGQVEGAFIMGLGLWTSEDLIYDPEVGNLTNYRTWNYKVPGAKDIPVDFRISLTNKHITKAGVLRSKAVGEPPFCMACSVPLAIRGALDSARADAGNTDVWYQLDNALTIEKILLSSLTDISAMVL